MNVSLSRSVIENVATAVGYRYSWDEDGDLRIAMSRKKGKDLVFYIHTGGIERGSFKLTCHCGRYFSPDEYLSAIVFCNDWNRDRLTPRAFVLRPDNDGDRRIILDWVLLCDTGVTIEHLKENLEFFIYTSHEFWEEADKAL